MLLIRNKLKAILAIAMMNLLTHSMADDICVWCNPVMSQTFLNCIHTEISHRSIFANVPASSMDDMKNSMLAASRAITNSNPEMKMSMMEGVMAGELIKLIESQSVFQNPDNVEFELMSLVGACYAKASGQPHNAYTMKLGQTIDLMMQAIAKAKFSNIPPAQHSTAFANSAARSGQNINNSPWYNNNTPIVLPQQQDSFSGASSGISIPSQGNVPPSIHGVPPGNPQVYQNYPPPYLNRNVAQNDQAMNLNTNIAQTYPSQTAVGLSGAKLVSASSTNSRTNEGNVLPLFQPLNTQSGSNSFYQQKAWSKDTQQISGPVISNIYSSTIQNGASNYAPAIPQNNNWNVAASTNLGKSNQPYSEPAKNIQLIGFPTYRDTRNSNTYPITDKNSASNNVPATSQKNNWNIAIPNNTPNNQPVSGFGQNTHQKVSFDSNQPKNTNIYPNIDKNNASNYPLAIPQNNWNVGTQNVDYNKQNIYEVPKIDSGNPNQSRSLTNKALNSPIQANQNAAGLDKNLQLNYNSSNPRWSSESSSTTDNGNNPAVIPNISPNNSTVSKDYPSNVNKQMNVPKNKNNSVVVTNIAPNYPVVSNDYPPKADMQGNIPNNQPVQDTKPVSPSKDTKTITQPNDNAPKNPLTTPRRRKTHRKRNNFFRNKTTNETDTSKHSEADNLSKTMRFAETLYAIFSKSDTFTRIFNEDLSNEDAISITYSAITKSFNECGYSEHSVEIANACAILIASLPEHCPSVKYGKVLSKSIMSYFYKEGLIRDKPQDQASYIANTILDKLKTTATISSTDEFNKSETTERSLTYSSTESAVTVTSSDKSTDYSRIPDTSNDGSVPNKKLSKEIIFYEGLYNGLSTATSFNFIFNRQTPPLYAIFWAGNMIYNLYGDYGKNKTTETANECATRMSSLPKHSGTEIYAKVIAKCITDVFSYYGLISPDSPSAQAKDVVSKLCSFIEKYSGNNNSEPKNINENQNIPKSKDDEVFSKNPQVQEDKIKPDSAISESSSSSKSKEDAYNYNYSTTKDPAFDYNIDYLNQNETKGIGDSTKSKPNQQSGGLDYYKNNDYNVPQMKPEIRQQKQQSSGSSLAESDSPGEENLKQRYDYPTHLNKEASPENKNKAPDSLQSQQQQNSQYPDSNSGGLTPQQDTGNYPKNYEETVPENPQSQQQNSQFPNSNSGALTPQQNTNNYPKNLNEETAYENPQSQQQNSQFPISDSGGLNPQQNTNKYPDKKTPDNKDIQSQQGKGDEYSNLNFGEENSQHNYPENPKDKSIPSDKDMKAQSQNIYIDPDNKNLLPNEDKTFLETASLSSESNEESKKRIKILMLWAVKSMENDKFNYQTYSGVISALTKYIQKEHPEIGANKALFKVLIDALIACTQLLIKNSPDYYLKKDSTKTQQNVPIIAPDSSSTNSLAQTNIMSNAQHYSGLQQNDYNARYPIKQENIKSTPVAQNPNQQQLIKNYPTAQQTDANIPQISQSASNVKLPALNNKNSELPQQNNQNASIPTKKDNILQQGPTQINYALPQGPGQSKNDLQQVPAQNNYTPQQRPPSASSPKQVNSNLPKQNSWISNQQNPDIITQTGPIQLPGTNTNQFNGQAVWASTSHVEVNNQNLQQGSAPLPGINMNQGNFNSQNLQQIRPAPSPGIITNQFKPQGDFPSQIGINNQNLQQGPVPLPSINMNQYIAQGDLTFPLQANVNHQNMQQMGPAPSPGIITNQFKPQGDSSSQIGVNNQKLPQTGAIPFLGVVTNQFSPQGNSPSQTGVNNQNLQQTGQAPLPGININQSGHSLE